MFVYFRAPVGWTELARRTLRDTLADGCPGLAAQLAFYFLLALFPALLFVIALLSALPIEPALDPLVARLNVVVPGERNDRSRHTRPLSRRTSVEPTRLDAGGTSRPLPGIVVEAPHNESIR